MVADFNIRTKTVELAVMNICPGQEPTTYRDPASCMILDRMGESVSSQRRFKDIIIPGIIEEPKVERCATYRDTTFDVAQIGETMRNLYLDNVSRRKVTEGMIAGRGIVMVADPARGLSDTTVSASPNGYNTLQRRPSLAPQQQQQQRREQWEQRQPPERSQKGGAREARENGDLVAAAGQKWRSLHNATSHNGVDFPKAKSNEPAESRRTFRGHSRRSLYR